MLLVYWKEKKIYCTYSNYWLIFLDLRQHGFLFPTVLQRPSTLCKILAIQHLTVDNSTRKKRIYSSKEITWWGKFTCAIYVLRLLIKAPEVAAISTVKAAIYSISKSEGLPDTIFVQILECPCCCSYQFHSRCCQCCQPHWDTLVSLDMLSVFCSQKHQHPVPQ